MDFSISVLVYSPKSQQIDEFPTREFLQIVVGSAVGFALSSWGAGSMPPGMAPVRVVAGYNEDGGSTRNVGWQEKFHFKTAQ